METSYNVTEIVLVTNVGILCAVPFGGGMGEARAVGQTNVRVMSVFAHR